MDDGVAFADEEKRGYEEFDDLYDLLDDVGYKRVRRSCSLGITTFHLRPGGCIPASHCSYLILYDNSKAGYNISRSP
jgi:hypothetical protein